MDSPDKSSTLLKSPLGSCPGSPAPLSPEAAKARRALTRDLILLGVLFCVPLFHLIQFAAESELYSYILLMPFVSLYLIWQRSVKPPGGDRPAYGPGSVFLMVGVGLLVAYGLALRGGGILSVDDRIAFTAASFVFCLLGVCCLDLGKSILRTVAFPLGMLVFMIPLPTELLDKIETFLQYGTAYVTDGMLSVAATPFIREGLIFRLSDIDIRVAPECSGIHSTWILLITSLLAGHLFLRSPWKRAALALFVVPLALLRNGFRVFTISELCVHIGPQMIHHWIHHKGGPIFFALSLIPFFILLIVLQKSDRVAKKAPNPPVS